MSANPKKTATRQIVLRRSSVDRRQLLEAQVQESSSRGRVRGIAEFAGGTTAECAAVCCCCPCSLVNLLVLAVYKLPAGLCRKAIRRKRRRRMMKRGLLAAQGGGGSSHAQGGAGVGKEEGMEFQIHPEKPMASDKEVMELEEEMWKRFYGTGFWRSPSQRDDES